MLPPDYIVRISLIRDEETLIELNPPVWRRFKISSAVNLDLMVDKIISPIMGWERNYHTYYFKHDGKYYVQQDSQASDAVNISSNEILKDKTLFKPEDAVIGDLLKKEGDKCVYNYDLGDNWNHVLELETIIPGDESDGKVIIMGGELRCPNEDGDGSANYQTEILDHLLKKRENPKDDTVCRKFAWDCFKRRGALNVNGSFRPEEFDIEERRVALAKALRDRNSTRNTTKTFSAGRTSHPLPLSYAKLGQKHIITKKQDDRFDHIGGYITMSETVNIKPDLKEFTLCYNCGSPNDLKSCGRCHAAFYCSRHCQTTHWSEGLHKRICKKEKAAMDKLEREIATNTPCPNRFDNDGGVILMQRYNPDKLRFKVGDKVECMIGESNWGTGRIVKLMYREPKWPSSQPSAPYQIKLDRKTADREGIPPKMALIYSDWDDDLKIRKVG